MDRIDDISAQWTNRQVEGNHTLFEIKGNYGKIKMMFLVIDVTPSVSPTTFTLPTAPFIISNVLLELNGLVVCRNTNTSVLSSMEKQSSTLYNDMRQGCNLPDPFISESRIIMPLFFWVYDGQMFDTDIYGKIAVRVYSKDTYQEMGFNNILSSLQFSLRIIYAQGGIPKPLNFEKAYNFFEYYKIAVPAGSTSTTQYLQLQRAVRSLNFMMVIQGSASRGIINRVTLTHTNGIRNVYDNRSNYYLGTDIGNNRNDTFSIVFNQSELMNLQNKPIVAFIEFEASNDYFLYVTYDYETEYEVYKDKTTDKQCFIELEPLDI